MNDNDDDDDAEHAFKQAIANAMPEIRANSARLRAKISDFFEVQLEHLPPAGSDGWSRMLATYVWTVNPDFGVENLRHMLDRKIFEEPQQR
jgi:hypothetical protein